MEENKELRVFILEACRKIEQEESESLRKIKKPELDDELLNQFISKPSPIQSAASRNSNRSRRKSSSPFSRPSCLRPRRSERRTDCCRSMWDVRRDWAIRLSI